VKDPDGQAVVSVVVAKPGWGNVLDRYTDTKDDRVVLDVRGISQSELGMQLTTRAFTTHPSSVLEYCHQCINWCKTIPSRMASAKKLIRELRYGAHSAQDVPSDVSTKVVTLV